MSWGRNGLGWADFWPFCGCAPSGPVSWRAQIATRNLRPAPLGHEGSARPGRRWEVAA